MWMIVFFVVMIAASFLMRPHSQKLQNILMSDSSFGKAILIVYNHMRVAGILVWGSDVRHSVNKLTGMDKYFQDLCYIIAEGGLGSTIVRIWVNGEPIYDIRPGFKVSSKYKKVSFTIYNGTEDEEPNALMEAVLGVGNTPTYRGRMHMVVENWPLHETGFVIPNFNFELDVAIPDPTWVPVTTANDIVGHTYDFGEGDDEGIGLDLVNDKIFQFIEGSNPVALCRNDLLTGQPEQIILLTTSTVISGNNTWFNRPQTCQAGYFYAVTWNTIPSPDAATIKLSKFDPVTLIEVGAVAPAGINATFNASNYDFVIESFAVGGTNYVMIMEDGDIPSHLTVVNVDTMTVVASAVYTPYDGQFAGGLDAAPPSSNSIDLYTTIFDSGGSFDLFVLKFTFNALLNTISVTLATTYPYPGTDFGFTLAPGSPTSGVIYDPSDDTVILFVTDPNSSTGQVLAKARVNSREVLWTIPLSHFTFIDWYNNMMRYSDISTGKLLIPFGNSGNTPPIGSYDYMIIDTATGDVTYGNTIHGQSFTEQTIWISSRNILIYQETGVNDSTDVWGGGWAVLFFLPSVAMDLQGIMEDVGTRVGLLSTDMDYSAGAGVAVEGAGVFSRQSAAAFIRNLQVAFFFDTIESGFKSKMVMRAGQSVAVTIPEDDVLADGEDAGFFEIEYPDVQELPPWIDFQYMDTFLDLQYGSEPHHRPAPIIWSTGDAPSSIPESNFSSAAGGIEINVPLLMESNDAATAGLKLLNAAWTESTTIKYGLTQKYLAYEPTDIALLQRTDDFNGSTETIESKTVQTDISASFAVKLQASTHAQAVYDATVATGSTHSTYTPETVQEIAAPIFVPMDTPLLRDTDDTPGMYAAMRGGAAGTITSGVALKSIDGGSSYDTIASFPGGAVAGTTSSGAMPAPTGPWEVLDTTTVLTVAIPIGILAPATIDDLINSNTLNLCMVGKEMCQFASATQVTTGVWQLSNLKRGCLGTEQHIADHTTSEDFVLVNSTLMATISYAASEIGATNDYEAELTSGDQTSSPVAVVQNCRRLLCRAPFDFTAVRDGSFNLTVTFQRRSRVAGKPFWSSPLFETVASFQADIMSGLTVKRTITATASGGASVVDPNALTIYYSAADQTTDFGSTQPTVDIRIYQLNEILGRGYPGEATV